jgi:hypothetical protein
MSGAFAIPDFTEERYRAVLDKAAGRFRFCRLGEQGNSPGVALWRHDIDFSPQRALALARIEAKMRVVASYFVLLGSAFYNPFEGAVSDVLREIAALGHDLGLHYDAHAIDGPTDHHVERIGFEANALSRHLGVPFRSFSLHNPSVSPDVQLDNPSYAGLMNASASALRTQFTYVSDSNGRWRHESLEDVLDNPASVRVYALTHPEWWTPESIPPNARVHRCIEGRATRVAADYRAFLTKHRPEVL